MGDSQNETPSVPSAWIIVGGSRFRKDQIQGFDAEYFPRSSLGGVEGNHAFLWLQGKKDPVRIPIHENINAFIERVEKELSQMPPQQVTPIALIPVRQGPPA